MSFKKGQLVMLVGSDGYTPPFGSIGEILGFDGEDYDVDFPSYPCPVPPGQFWCCLPSWLMPIQGDVDCIDIDIDIDKTLTKTVY